jgi:hypothetical protein
VIGVRKYSIGVSKLGGLAVFRISGTLPGSTCRLWFASAPSGSSVNPSSAVPPIVPALRRAGVSASAPAAARP